MRATPDPGYAPLDDSPLAEIVAEMIRDRFRYAGKAGWYRYRAGVWAECTEADATEAVRRAMRRLHAKWIKDADADRARKLAALLSATKIRNVLSLTRGMVDIDITEFDQHPDLLNVQNGTVDLRTGQLLAHNPAHLLTKQAGAPYDPDANHPSWPLALQALPADQHDWLQIRCGQAATGYPPPDDKTIFHQGSGSNGKSGILHALRAALGSHAVMVPERLLIASPGEHPTELTTLMGARFALLEELPENGRINAKRLKDTVGTPRMTARRIRQDDVTWDATHTLFVSTNPKPRFSDTDWAVWRRMVLLPYPYTFLPPGEPLEKDDHRHGVPGLRESLQDDPKIRPTVLAWIVKGAVAWYAAGKVMPPEPAGIALATAAWRASSDQLGDWLSERVELAPGWSVLSTELFEDFSEWLRRHGHTPWSDQTFTDRLKAHPTIAGEEVEKRRRTTVPHLSRRLGHGAPHQGKVTVWDGLKFQG